MKEYMELRSMNGMIEAVTEDKVEKLGGEWLSQNHKISVLNDYARDRWMVVGYTPHSILLERQRQSK
ncbi:hypothetical protein CVD28_01010 [Bacillus sp. M6-12]|uniref:hypothetical protein n=1 Tax=Bacillus sp. M6-12 TaxID=2054166 RepID=UPI000C7571DB|nr:hypothetical protein [Bacillus sp. M6-12]PLS19013.1 hypothetical protein CVD28_01010 [Bacillus sp. M6-12]